MKTYIFPGDIPILTTFDVPKNRRDVFAKGPAGPAAAPAGGYLCRQHRRTLLVHGLADGAEGGKTWKTWCKSHGKTRKNHRERNRGNFGETMENHWILFFGFAGDE